MRSQLFYVTKGSDYVQCVDIQPRAIGGYSQVASVLISLILPYAAGNGGGFNAVKQTVSRDLERLGRI